METSGNLSLANLAAIKDDLRRKIEETNRETARLQRENIELAEDLKRSEATGVERKAQVEKVRSKLMSDTSRLKWAEDRARAVEAESNETSAILANLDEKLKTSKMKRESLKFESLDFSDEINDKISDMMATQLEEMDLNGNDPGYGGPVCEEIAALEKKAGEQEEELKELKDQGNNESWNNIDFEVTLAEEKLEIVKESLEEAKESAEKDKEELAKLKETRRELRNQLLYGNRTMDH